MSQVKQKLHVQESTSIDFVSSMKTYLYYSFHPHFWCIVLKDNYRILEIIVKYDLSHRW